MRIYGGLITEKSFRFMLLINNMNKTSYIHKMSLNNISSNHFEKQL